MSSQAVYCLSLQIQPNENGQNTVSSSNAKNEATAKLSATTAKQLESMQQQQQHQQQQLHQKQQQQQQPLQHQQLANNIILLRGSRNENGQIIIQNKHDIISFINEQQQQQQQLQHDKQISAATTTLASQLPTTTTIARKIHTGISVVASTPGGNGNNISKDTSQTAAAATTAAVAATSSQNAVVPTTSNTILLQTPINASQLESVLLQSANMKKTSSALNERSFLIKNSSRSLSTDSNRISNTDSKGPFVLQTLKRLEKSQSILVIRNSSSNNSTAPASATSTLTSTSKYNASNSNSAGNELSNSNIPTTATVSTNTGGATTPQGVLSSNNNHTNSLTSLSFTRASKGQQQQTKLANIIAANRTITAANSTLSTSSSSSSVSLSASSAALSTSLSSLKSSTSNGTPTTTTYLRLGTNTTVAAAAAALANKNRNGNSNNNVKANVVVVGSNNYNSNNNNQSNNRTILNGVVQATDQPQQQQTTQKLSLADVHLKHEHRTTSSSSTATTVAVTVAATATAAGQQQQTNVPLGNDGEPIKLPDNLESLPRADSFPSQRHRWNTNEEIAAILISFDKHNEWQSKEVKTRPKSGSLLLYSRKKVRYRRDGYCWKKRKDGKTTREDHMKLKVQGTECIYGCYVHSAILPTFHRRCYWLLQNPDIVLVHYLNVPYPDDNKMAVIAPSITLWGDKKEWTKEELVSQLKPMLSSVTSDDDSDSGNDIEISTAETVESIVCQLMEKQRLSRQAALVKQLDCGCADSSCIDGKSCSHPVMRRTGLLKSVSSDKRGNFSDNYNQTTSATPNVVIGPKLYSRWPDRRQRDDGHHYQQQQHHAHQQLTQEGAIKFQIIQPQHNDQQQQHHQQHQPQQPQHYRHHNSTHVTPHHQLFINRNNLIIQHHHQQQQQQQQQQHANFNQTNAVAAAAITTATSNVATAVANNQNNQINLQRFVANHSNNNNTNGNSNNNLQINNNRLQIAKTTITATTTIAAAATSTPTAAAVVASSAIETTDSMSGELIENQNHISANSNINSNSNKINRNSNQLTLQAPQQQQQQNLDANTINNNNYNYNTSNQLQQQQQQEIYKMQQQQHQQQQQQHKQSTTNDIKIDFQPPTQHQQHGSTNNSSSLNSVQPMCMSPEHQPSTPTHASSGNQHKSNPLLAQGGVRGGGDVADTALTISTAVISSSSSPVANSNSSASSSSTSSSMSSFPSPLMDNNAINQKQLSPVNITIKSENSIKVNERLNQQQQQQQKENCLIAVDGMNDTAAETTETSLRDDESNSQQQESSTIASNIKLSEYNSNTNNGCQTISASSDTNSNITEPAAAEQQQLEVRTQERSQDGTTISFESMETNNVESTHDAAAVGEHANISHELHETLGFFNETLDLSQEDIQRTLIANLPFDSTEAQTVVHSGPHVAPAVGADGYDFLANTCGANDANDAIPVSDQINCGGADDDDDETDDVFVNLDAFDMLVEFPDIDLDDKQALSQASLEHAAAAVSVQLSEITASAGSQNCNIINQHLLTSSSAGYEVGEKQSTSISSSSSALCTRKLLNICDFSPEWSYPEGGVKVLVAGPWTNLNASYTVLFDSLPVPTLMVQEGVLRCYCPAHEVGFATLQVSCDGYVVSNSVMFEYKMSPCPEAPYDVTSNDCLYKFSLLNRLSSIDEQMQIKTEAGTLKAQYSVFFQANFEEKLVSYCHQLMKGTWRSNTSSWTSGIKGMSLLHLAAALGYSKLVCAMLNWRAENPNFILETELDALSQDIYGYTPMTWACARGHVETALILYKWNQNALKIKNYAQQSPLDIANLKGHKSLLSEVYRLECERNKKYNKNSLDIFPMYLNKYEFGDKNNTKIEHPSNEEFFDEKVGEHIFASLEASFDVPRSHDGVFLRPVAVASNQSPPNNSRFSKRSSVDSGINMDIRSKSGKSLKDIKRLQSFDTHDGYSLSVESPLDNFNTTNATNSLLSPMRKMDFALCEVSTGDSSPLPDKDHDDSSTINNDDITDVVINSETDGVVGDSDAKVLTLAEHIIAAMPERIKNEADEMMVLGSPMTEPLNSESSGLNDSFMDPLLDSLPNTHFDSDFSLDFNDHSYRYHDVSTPSSSLSPASSGPLQSPASYSLLGIDPSVNSPSPPPSTKQLTEFLHASSCNQYPFEADFSRLTLTDSEQRELYEAAKCIQKAYRSYKGRQKLEEQNKERSAATVIQNYYRRYKQYAYYRQMTNAALVIQHGYRSYCRHKRFKKSQSSTTTATSLGGSGSQNNLNGNSQCLSSFYDHYKNDQQNQELLMNSQPSTPKETSPSGPLKRTYSQSTQNQAARKIQQFMRQSRIKLQKERAEKEKLVHQRRAEYLQSLQFRGQPEIVCSPEQSESNHVKLFNALHQQE